MTQQIKKPHNYTANRELKTKLLLLGFRQNQSLEVTTVESFIWSKDIWKNADVYIHVTGKVYKGFHAGEVLIFTDTAILLEWIVTTLDHITTTNGE
jgi:hypothetical protein